MGASLTFAERYVRWWAPVLAPTALRLLDVVRDGLGTRPPDEILDLGTGTGTLAVAARTRWPRARVVGLDPDAGMLAVARAEGDRAFGRDHGLEFLSGTASAIPLRDGSVDALVSSFVLQLVEDRAAAWREAWRVLRPGGIVAVVSWRGDTPPFRPQAAFDRTLAEFGLASGIGSSHAGGLGTPSSAAAELRTAGFREVESHMVPLGYRFEPEFFLGWKEHLDERRLFDTLDGSTSERLKGSLRERLSRFTPDELVRRDPVVHVTGRRSE
jgi:SAM-dependent methyltransferase